MSSHYQPNDPNQYGPRPPHPAGGDSGPPQEKKGWRKLKWWHWLLIALAFFFVVGQCTGPGVEENTSTVQERLEDDPEPTPEPEPSPEPEPEPTREPEPEPDPAPQAEKAAQDQLYLDMMREDAPMMSEGETDEDLHNIGRGVCIYLDQGNTVLDIITEFMVIGDDAANAELGTTIGLAVAAKCPEHLDEMTAEVERLQSR